MVRGFSVPFGRGAGLGELLIFGTPYTGAVMLSSGINVSASYCWRANLHNIDRRIKNHALETSLAWQ